ncbi:family 1 glycosylhydrolase [Streptomyces sp. NPDC020096]
MTTSVPGPNGFPAGFSWGTASSATQSQGATPADNWWDWEQAGKAPRSGDGNDFDKLYASDFALLADWGFSDYRLSLDWARIEPQPGQHDRQAIEHYRQILLAGRDAGLTMWVCLLHTALPAWFAAQDGFLSPTAGTAWARHVDFIAETFGDLADGWMPVNNPTAYALFNAPTIRRLSL